MPTKTFTSFHDERQGQWTRVEFEPARLTFVPSRPKTHWLATLLTILILIALVLGFLQSPMGIVLLVVIVVLIISHLLGRTPRNPIVIDTQSTSGSRGTSYHVHQVRRFTIRENTRRDPVEDSHLLQVYMELKGVERLVLLYQDYFTDARNEETREIFDRMSQWLKDAK